eukprot:7837349-Pyramimonas_sp.AAC.1
MNVYGSPGACDAGRAHHGHAVSDPGADRGHLGGGDAAAGGRAGHGHPRGGGGWLQAPALLERGGHRPRGDRRHRGAPQRRGRRANRLQTMKASMSVKSCFW